MIKYTPNYVNLSYLVLCKLFYIAFEHICRYIFHCRDNCHAGMKGSKSILTGTILFLLTICISNAQIRNSFFSNYTIQDGLSDDKIHCIYQDSHGWIWIGSSFGVLRFDGYEFHKFQINTVESEILGKSLIRTIYEDRDKRIWIGTENHGLFIYDRSVYGLEHIALKILNKFKKKVSENEVVWLINLFQILVILIGFVIFRGSIF